MFYSRCTIMVVILHVLLLEVGSFVLLERTRQRRDDGWLDTDMSQQLWELSEVGDVFMGDVMNMADWGMQHFNPSSFLVPLERLSTSHDTARQLKPKDKRKRLTTPLDTIGSSVLSSLRNRKDYPEES